MRSLITLFMVLFAVGCSADRYVDMIPVNLHSWDKSVSILYDNADTLSLCNISVALRYNSDFAADTLSVMVQVSLPDAYQSCEKVTLCLDRPYKAAAVTGSELTSYRRGCCLDQRGYYIFTITPCSAVKGIEAVGIGIDKE